MGHSSTVPTLSRRNPASHLFEVLDDRCLALRAPYTNHDQSSFAAMLDLAQALAAGRFQTFSDTNLIRAFGSAEQRWF